MDTYTIKALKQFIMGRKVLDIYHYNKEYRVYYIDTENYVTHTLKSFCQSGRKTMDYHYFKGLPHGKCRGWLYVNGQLLYTNEYVNGKMIGEDIRAVSRRRV